MIRMDFVKEEMDKILEVIASIDPIFSDREKISKGRGTPSRCVISEIENERYYKSVKFNGYNPPSFVFDIDKLSITLVDESISDHHVFCKIGGFFYSSGINVEITGVPKGGTSYCVTAKFGLDSMEKKVGEAITSLTKRCAQTYRSILGNLDEKNARDVALLKRAMKTFSSAGVHFKDIDDIRLFMTRFKNIRRNDHGHFSTSLTSAMKGEFTKVFDDEESSKSIVEYMNLLLIEDVGKR